jgi:4-carboxymuconolactone decarboxylase
MSRLIPIAPDRISAEQAAIAQRLAAGPRGGVCGPFEAWLHSPMLARHFDDVGAYLRFETALPARLVQMTILKTVGFWRSRFAWNRHVILARNMHIDDAVIDSIRDGTTPLPGSTEERAAFRFVDALLQRQATSHADWDRLVQAFGERGAVDLVALVGYYSLVSLTLAANDADSEEPDPFATPDQRKGSAG